MPGDNFKVEVHSEGRTHFDAAVRIAFANAPGGKASHFLSPVPTLSCENCAGGKTGHWIGEDRKQYCEYKCRECDGTGKNPTHAGMVLLWHEDTVGGVAASPLPFPLTVDAAVDFLWRYLESAEFGCQPDHDGSNGKGFIVSTGNFWGHVEGSYCAFIGVYPDWQMYGK
jgi:hypothetical protein